MKKVSASEARKRWFGLLDEAVQGEVIVVERGTHRLVLRREASKPSGPGKSHPDYRRLLRVPKADEADRWAWEWRGPGQK
ncbi:MAG: hypothetical protein ACRELS_08175 [Candidatus Rokuibacteriota bacterium]